MAPLAANAKEAVPMADKHQDFVLDQWLTQVLQRDVYQLLATEDFVRKAENKATAENRLLTELQSRRVFIYTKVSTEAPGVVRFLESRGFNLIDTSVTFDKPVAPALAASGAATVRFAVAGDRDQVVELARRSFSYSRFHLDSALTRQEADRIKAEWVKNYFAGGRGNAMVVALAGEMVAGFLLLIYGKAGALVIDLIAIDENQRRKGIARDMIAYAESQCHGFTRLSVGTQVANIPSIRLYEGMGFKLASSQYVFHYHHN